jgi:hypothetical protein
MTRGCGKRKPGGVYICTKLSPHGAPLEEFIIDPPEAYEGEKFRVPIIFEKNGKNHLLFWVGKEFYPFPSDFIEEVRRFGASKRVPVEFPVQKLSMGSLMFFVHSLAIIKNHNVLPPPPLCPKRLKSHLSNETYCLGHSYQVAPLNCEGRRKVGDTVYDVKPVTPGVPLEFASGIFLRLPITDIDHVVYKDGKPDPRVKEREPEVKIPLNYTFE